MFQHTSLFQHSISTVIATIHWNTNNFYEMFSTCQSHARIRWQWSIPIIVVKYEMMTKKSCNKRNSKLEGYFLSLHSTILFGVGFSLHIYSVIKQRLWHIAQYSRDKISTDCDKKKASECAIREYYVRKKVVVNWRLRPVT